MSAQAHSRRWWVCPWFEPTKACKHKNTHPPISRRPEGCYFNFPLETTKCERCSLNELCDSTSSSSVSVSSTPLERSRIVCTCYRGTCEGGGRSQLFCTVTGDTARQLFTSADFGEVCASRRRRRCSVLCIPKCLAASAKQLAMCARCALLIRMIIPSTWCYWCTCVCVFG